MSSDREVELRAEVSCERRGPWLALGSRAAFEWTRVRLPVPGLAGELEGLKIVHLSDLHARGSWSRGYDRLIERVEASGADLVVFTGDFVDDKHDHRAALPVLERLLPRLKARLGVWGILGNHDVDVVGPYLLGMGVHLIDGRRVELASASGAKLELIGLPGVARTDMDARFVASMPAKSAGALRVVLSHYPDHLRRVRPLGADLFLAGHTHGGQCCLPGGRPIITHDSLPKAMCKGVHRVVGCWMVVSRGFGFAGIGLRVFCPAEVGEIVVVGAS